MKLIIAGSRSLTNFNILLKGVEEFGINVEKISEIVSGGATGADKLGELFAHSNKIPIKLFKADWIRYGIKAGYLRNKQMAIYADVLLALWNGESKGTEHMINIMKKLKKPYYIKLFNN